MRIFRSRRPDSAPTSSLHPSRRSWRALPATGYGLVDEQSAATFVLNTWLLGSDFDERIPGLQQILSSKQLSPGTKADALTNFSVTVFHELEQVKGAA